MRFPKIVLLVTALLFAGASTASAYNITLGVNPGSADPANLAASDSLIVDVYIDADRGTGFFAVALLWENTLDIRYDQFNPLTTMPSYVLYAPGVGQNPTTYLIPNANPPNYWNGNNVPGKRQLLVELLEPSFGSATASGLNVWIATIVFHVDSTANFPQTLEMTLNANGTIVEVYTNDVAGLTTITNGVLNLPEPSAALVAVAALATVVVVRSRRRS